MGRARARRAGRRSSTPRRATRSTSRSSCPGSGAAAAGTRRSPTSCAASRRAGTRARSGSTTRSGTSGGAAALPRVLRAVRRARARRPRRLGAAPTSPSRPAGRPSRPCCGCDGCGARAHLVQDDEPEFYPASAERLWAERAFRLPAITAGTWLAERMRARGLHATPFDLGIDHATYRPQPGVAARRDRVLFYARAATPRRAVPLGLLALAELHRAPPARPRSSLFGDAAPLTAPFPFTHLGILDPPEVARAYAEATVGLVLSLTNHSLAAQEMARVRPARGRAATRRAPRPRSATRRSSSPPRPSAALADALERAARRARRARRGRHRLGRDADVGSGRGGGRGGPERARVDARAPLARAPARGRDDPVPRLDARAARAAGARRVHPLRLHAAAGGDRHSARRSTATPPPFSPELETARLDAGPAAAGRQPQRAPVLDRRSTSGCGASATRALGPHARDAETGPNTASRNPPLLLRLRRASPTPRRGAARSSTACTRCGWPTCRSTC